MKTNTQAQFIQRHIDLKAAHTQAGFDERDQKYLDVNPDRSQPKTVRQVIGGKSYHLPIE